ncbi:MAG: class I SAM-dependent methyltransferase [Planctomycetes bacterium]|nr:class I SAM-dependent methyltransferase [Planctomycetota bacterium]
MTNASGGPAPVLVRLPDGSAMRQMFHVRYGGESALGWGPRLRREYDYFTPDDYYEALVAGLVAPGSHWLDVGCGRELFPSNHALANALSRRCSRLVGLDPDPTLAENRWVHERVAAGIDDYDGEAAFDVVTLRMVAEHISEPERCVERVAGALRPGGVAVVYTVFGYSPMPLLTRLAPMALRHVVKSWLWGTQPKDTFPTRFRMNTRSKLARLFDGVGMREHAFERLDDCRTFQRFRFLNEVELAVRTLCRGVGLPYPEHCLLGIYRKPGSSAHE